MVWQSGEGWVQNADISPPGLGQPALLVRTGIEIGPPVLLSKIWIIRERALSLKEAKSLSCAWVIVVTM